MRFVLFKILKYVTMNTIDVISLRTFARRSMAQSVVKKTCCTNYFDFNSEQFCENIPLVYRTGHAYCLYDDR